MGIEQRHIEESLFDVRFECDLASCRGACCTMPGAYGAPLRPEEIPIIEAALPAVEKYLSEHHLEVIRRRGFHQQSANDYTTVCIDDRACVFVSFENDIALCVFEKAWAAGELNWRKPLSCHLFPLRENRRDNSSLRFEWIPECQPALIRGELNGTSVIDFLRDALVRLIGDKEFTILSSIRDGNRNHPRDSCKGPNKILG